MILINLPFRSDSFSTCVKASDQLIWDILDKYEGTRRGGGEEGGFGEESKFL